MSSHARISVSQLQRLIGTPSVPVIVDVCLDEDFAASANLIPTAIRVPHSRILQRANQWQGKAVVVVCQKGLKLSEGAAALLRTAGINAEYLQGGMMAWHAEGAPLISARAIPQRTPQGHTLWVTRSRPKIDRIACPWLIRRFVDSDAQFLFVSGSQVNAVAEKFSATPFDVDQVVLSHQDDLCTFDALLAHFGLQTTALLHLAKLVRVADTNQHHLAAEAAGLLAISVGLSRLYRNDLEQLEAGMAIYDALYRWARDARDETHDSAIHISAAQADHE